MAAGGEVDGAGRDETPLERSDRNFNELLQELRVAQTGTQILFAFLLATAFTSLLQESDDFARRLLAFDLVVSAVATALLITPVALHRALFRRRMKVQLVDLAGALARAGLALTVVAFSGTCLLALDAVLSRPVAVGISAGVLLVFVALWGVLPLVVGRGRSRGWPPG